jgi:hypothetical protein
MMQRVTIFFKLFSWKTCSSEQQVGGENYSPNWLKGQLVDEPTTASNENMITSGKYDNIT